MMLAHFLKELKYADRFSLNVFLSEKIVSLTKTLPYFGYQVLTILDT